MKDKIKKAIAGHVKLKQLPKGVSSLYYDLDEATNDVIFVLKEELKSLFKDINKELSEDSWGVKSVIYPFRLKFLKQKYLKSLEGE